MKVWLAQTGENHPFQLNTRKMRTAMLADALMERGHSVTWWSSNFYHPTKTKLFDHYHEVEVQPGYTIKLLDGLPYSRNVSLQRFLHHKLLAKEFRKRARREPVPNLLLACIPSYDLAYEFALLAETLKIPFAVDVRDSWPDSFLEHVPAWAGGLARLVLHGDFKKLSHALNRADQLFASSTGLMDWAKSKVHADKKFPDQVLFHGYPDPGPAADPKDLRPEISELVKTLGTKVGFTFVGTFGKAYDLSLVIKAAKQFQDEGNEDLYFVLGGGGDQESKLKEEARGLKNLTFAGWLNKPEIDALLFASKVGLVTYREVSYFFPNKAFEYLAHDLPMLSSLPGDLETLLNDKKVGYTYKTGDVDSFKDFALKFANQPDQTQEFATNARQVFQNTYSQSIIYKKFASCLDQLGTTD